MTAMLSESEDLMIGYIITLDEPNKLTLIVRDEVRPVEIVAYKTGHDTWHVPCLPVRGPRGIKIRDWTSFPRGTTKEEVFSHMMRMAARHTYMNVR